MQRLGELFTTQASDQELASRAQSVPTLLSGAKGGATQTPTIFLNSLDKGTTTIHGGEEVFSTKSTWKMNFALSLIPYTTIR